MYGGEKNILEIPWWGRSKKCGWMQRADFYWPTDGSAAFTLKRQILHKNDKLEDFITHQMIFSDKNIL